MEVINLPITQIKPYFRNPRNNEKAIAQVMKSIESYGFNQPIVLDRDRVIIVGHSRYKALMNLGWAEVPCVISDMPPAKAKEYRVIDNKSAELADWDYENLIVELREFESLPDFQDFFPDLDLTDFVAESVGASEFKDVTQKQVDKKQGEMDEVFKDRQASAVGQYIERTCPECGGSFAVARDDILKRLH